MSDLCALPGLDGKLHCHCSDRMGLACRARTHLLHKAVMKDVYNCPEMYIGGAKMSYYGYDMCSCYIMCNRFWVKCFKNISMKLLRFLSPLGLCLNQYDYSPDETLIEFKNYGPVGSSQIMDCLKSFSTTEGMGEGGELDFGDYKLCYGTVVKAFVRFK